MNMNDANKITARLVEVAAERDRLAAELAKLRAAPAVPEITDDALREEVNAAVILATDADGITDGQKVLRGFAKRVLMTWGHKEGMYLAFRDAVTAPIPEEWREVMAGLVAIAEKKGKKHGSPNHCHKRPGVWDDDNGPALSGKPCAECAMYDRARALLQSAPQQDSQGVPDGDDFNGTTPHLIQCMEALVRLDADGVLVPHGIGRDASRLLTAAANRLRKQTAPSVPEEWRGAAESAVKAMRWWAAQEDGVPEQVAPAYMTLHTLLGWSVSCDADQSAMSALLQSAPQATAISVRLINALREMKARAYKQLDHGKGRAIFIDSNIAIDIADVLLQSADHSEKSLEMVTPEFRTNAKDQGICDHD